MFPDGNTTGSYTVRVRDTDPAPPPTQQPAQAPQGSAPVQAPAQQQDAGTSVSEPADGDLAADTTTAGRVAVGGFATGAIGAADEFDWFAVELVAGRSYVIDLEGSATGGGTLENTVLRGLYDAGGIRIDGTQTNGGGEGGNARLSFTAQADGTHYIAARGFGDTTGSYTVRVTDTDPVQPPAQQQVQAQQDSAPDETPAQQQTPPASVSEPADGDLAADTTTAGRVAVGGMATGEVGTAGDWDWFAVELEAGKIYQIDLRGTVTGDGTLRDPYLCGVHDAAGTLIAGTVDDDDGARANSRVTFLATETATYYVAAGALLDGEGTYALSVTDVTDTVVGTPLGPQDDFAAGTGTTGTVVVGGSATGKIEAAGDRDWFAVEFEAGRTYQLDLEGSGSAYAQLGNTYLYGVHDAEGNFLPGTANDDGAQISVGVATIQGGHDSRVFFTADESATYYVAAGGKGGAWGDYRLSVTDVTDSHEDDFAAGTGTTGTVAVGGSATGAIEAGSDIDWFAVALEAGTTYRIDMEGARTNAGTLRDPYLRGIHDAQGNLVSGTDNDDGGAGRNSRVAFTADADATYYVAAGAWRGLDGTYTLSVEEVI